MTITDQDAAALNRKLVQGLIASGALTDPAWIKAFEVVPRHLFTPSFYRPGSQQIISRDHPEQAAEWLASVYQDQALVTHLIDGNTASSSTQPATMAVMLEALDVADGMRVKDVGGGTGFNGALLCHRLGEDSVVLVELVEAVAQAARRHLADAGYRPTVIIGDGAQGHLPAETGRKATRSYSRIIATCGISAVPLVWLRELTANGLIVAPLGGGVVRVRRISDTRAVGRFLATPAYFMPLRTEGDDGIVRRPEPLPADLRQSTVPFGVVVDEDFRFLLGLVLPGLRWQYDLDAANSPTGARLWSADGSIADVRDDGTVAEAGPRRLWTALESAHRVFQAHDRPTRERFGLTVKDDRQQVWLDEPSGPAWPI